MAKEHRRGGPDGRRAQARMPDRSPNAPQGDSREISNQHVGELAADHADSGTDSGSGVGSGPVADVWRSATEGPAGHLPHQARLESVFGVSLDDVEAYFGQGDAMQRIGGHAGQARNQIVFSDDSPPFEQAAEEVAHLLQGRQSGGGSRASGTSRTSDPAEVEAKHAASGAVSGTAPVLGATPRAAVHLDADDSVTDARRRALEIKDAFTGSWWSEDEERALAQIRGQSPLMIREIRAQYAEVTDGGSLENDFREYCNSDQYTEALALLWAELPLLDRLKTNVEPGWLWDSANETGLLDVLRSASEAQLAAAAADPAVTTLLRDNLDDDEYFEAARMIDPGATYDLVVDRIRSANGVLNDDEGAVYDAVLELSVDERRQLWEEHQGDLFGFLSDGERDRVRRMLLGSEADALSERMGAATEGLGTDDDAVAAVAARVQTAAQEQAALQRAIASGQGADGQALDAEQLAAMQTRLTELGGVSELTRVERDADGDIADDSFMGQLHGDLSGQEFQAFSRQMGASGFDRAKQQILDAVGLINDDEQAIYDAFDAVVAEVQVPPGADAATIAALQQQANQALRRQLWNDPQVLQALSHLNVEELGIAATFRDADPYQAALQRLTDAYEGWNTDEEGIFRVVTGLSPADRQRILAERPSIYQRMTESLSATEVVLLDTALRDGRLPADAALDYAMGGSFDGTREDLINETFAGLSHDERYLYRLGYWLHSTGRDPADAVQQGALDRFLAMHERLEGELGTDDLQRALDAMVGVPTPQELETEQGRLMAGDILRERMGDKQDVSGGLADAFTQTDESRDQASAQLEAQYQLAIEDGLLSADELAVLAALDANYQERYAENVAANEQIAGIASTVAAIAAGIVVTVLTGGTAGPAVAGFLAQYGAAAMIGGVAGAAAKVGTQELMAGDHYDAASSEGVRDAALGFTDGAMTVLSAGLASRFASMVGLQRSALAGQMTAGVTETTGGALAYAGRAAVRTGVQSSIEGFLAGAVGEVVMTAADEATWRRSVWGVIAEMGSAILRGGGIGAATGFVTGGVMDALSGFVEARRIPGLVSGLEDAGVDGDRLRRLSMRSLQQLGEADAALAAGNLDEAEELFRRLSSTLDSGEIARIRQALARQHGVDLGTHAAEGRVAQLSADSAFADSGFHGSSSAMLDGLEQTDGVIHSAEELHRRSVSQVTGEGDAFSGRSGRKSFISIGMGESGFGTSLAYADATQNLNHYNVQRYTYDELTHEADRLRTIVDSFDTIDVQVNRQSPVGAFGTKEQGQFASQLDKLQAELDLRDMLPSSHPRRVGGPGNAESYPVLFEFDLDGMKTRARPDVKEGKMLGGEGMAYDSIDLPQRMSRAYAPEANLEEFQARLEQIVGHSNFEVLPLEALGALPQGLATGSRQATFKGLHGLQRNFEEIQRMYQQAALDGTPITAEEIMQALKRAGQ